MAIMVKLIKLSKNLINNFFTNILKYSIAIDTSGLKGNMIIAIIKFSINFPTKSIYKVDLRLIFLNNRSLTQLQLSNRWTCGYRRVKKIKIE